MIRLGLREEIATPENTPAHEIGHILGLANCDRSGSIMGAHATGRRFMADEQQLVHEAVERRINGMRMPDRMRTQFPQAAYRFAGQRR